MTAAEPIDQAAARTYREAFHRGIRPDPALTVSAWADRYRILTTRSSPEPGPWRTARTPYLKEPMDCLSPLNRAEMVVLMTGAQIGKTECGNNWVGYNIHLAPGPILVVQPTVEMAKRNSKQRIAPLIEDCEPLKERVREPRARDSSNTVLSKEFPGGVLVMVGANSAKGLRSMPARYLFLDEIDGYVGDVDGEGDPVDLVLARTTNFPRRKVLLTSTPVLAGRSRIERYYESSDQCHFYVPCPFCIEMQTLRIENLRWPKKDPDAAHYVCEQCGRSIPNHAKNWMLPRGEWRAHAVSNGKVRGFYLSSLYSPVGWLSWGQIARKHEEAQGSPEKLQVFSNTILGLPWTDEGEVPEIDRLYDRREAYEIGKVPAGGLVLTAGADVQPKRIEVEIVAWGRFRQSWSVDYRVFEGDTQQPKVWQDLATLMDEDFETEYGQPVRISKLAVDTGFNTTAVYEWVRRMMPSRVMAVKGNTTSSAMVNLPNLIEVGPQGRRLKSGIRLWSVNVSMAKEQLYRWLRNASPDFDKGEAWPVGSCHFPQYSKEYFEQLTAEQLMTTTDKNGYRKTKWVKVRDRNEALDARVYAMAAAVALRLDTWTATKWDDVEKSLTIERKVVPMTVLRERGIAPTSPMPEFKPFSSEASWSDE